MTNLDHARPLQERITNGSFNLSVVGIGRVGLPLALSFAKHGVHVIGIDRNPEHVELVNSGVMPFLERGAKTLLKDTLHGKTFQATTDTRSAVARSDVVVLTVGTPLSANLRADTSQLEDALEEIGPALSPDTLVITRSTVSPGTTERLVAPTLERLSGLQLGVDLFVAFCPERIAEGNALQELQQLPEIIGSTDELSGHLAEALFTLLGPDKLMNRTDPLSAELAKLFTNVYRYVNFALANEYALIAEHYGRDAHQIIRMLRQDYDRAPVPLPGPAGGPCLSKDGYFLIEELAFPDFVLTAWKLNDSVPAHLVRRLNEALKQAGHDISGLKITVLGRAFKADIDDDRLSPAVRVIEMLERLGANVVVHDPYIEDIELEDALENAIGVVLATNHRMYYDLDMARVAELVAPSCVIVDAWAVFDPGDALAKGLDLRTFGRG